MKAFLGAVCCMLAACTPPGPGDAGVTDAGALDAGGMDASVPDSGAADAGPCAAISATIGADGGRLELCGASLEVPPGILSGPRTFGIEQLQLPTDGLVFGFEPAAPHAFRFTPEGTNLGFTVDVRVPHEPLDGHEGILAAYRGPVHPDGWFPVPPCEVNAGDLHAVVGLLGTFGVLKRTEVYPRAPTGLGAGGLTATLGAQQVHCAVSTSNTGYAVEAVDTFGTHTVRIMCDGPPDGGGARVSLGLDFRASDAGVAGDIINASWSSSGGTWSYSSGNTSLPAPSTWFVQFTAPHVSGTLVTTAHASSGDATLSMQLDATLAPFRDVIFDDAVCR